MADAVPIVCSLSGSQLRERATTLLRRFGLALIATEELPNGYAFRLAGDNETVALLAELIAAERQCCPFLTFEVTSEPNLGPIVVRITGPENSRLLFKTFLTLTRGVLTCRKTEDPAPERESGLRGASRDRT